MADIVDTRPVLVAEGITASIDDQVLVPPTDIVVDIGECVALTGPNGSGKTTLLRLISGRLAPSDGTVVLDDESVDERSSAVRSALSVLIGVPALYPALTLGDHVQLVHTTWDTDGGVDTDLERFGIGELRDRFVHELSSGQQQLFSLALVFARPSRVLVLDEPEQRLDADRKDLFAAAVEAVLAEGRSVVMACHDHDLVARLARRQVSL